MTKTTMMLASLAMLPALMTAGPAAAQTQSSVSGLLYTDFSAPTDGRAASYNVTRAFLTGKAKFSDIWSAAITYNAYPQAFVTGVTGGVATIGRDPYDALLHNAYFQATGLVPNVNLQMGLLTSPWFEFESAYWGYRMLGYHYFPVFSAGYIPPFDFGLKAFGNVGPVGYMAQVDNGTGFRATENNGSKAYTAGLTVAPVPGLTLAALGYRGDTITLSQMDRYAAFAGYRTGTFRVAAEGTRMVNQAVAGPVITGQILSAYTVLGLPVTALPSPELIARMDVIDSDVNAGSQTETIQGLVGFAIKPAPGVILALDDQVTRKTAAGVTTTSNTVAMHTQFAF